MELRKTDKATQGRYEQLRLEINQMHEKINKWADNGKWFAIVDFEGKSNISKYKEGYRQPLYKNLDEFLK